MYLYVRWRYFPCRVLVLWVFCVYMYHGGQDVNITVWYILCVKMLTSTCVAYPSSQGNNQALRLVQFNGLFKNPRTSPHTSTKRREGINPKENALKPRLISITYNTSSLAQPIKLRLTAPNWERPSPDYGSHIIMSITGIYLRISIHTQYHLQVLSSNQVHEITYFIIHITH